MEFVPYEQFINIEFIAEGGFSKIYKANWKDGPIESYSNKNIVRIVNYKVVLKKINDSKNITSKKLNEAQREIPKLGMVPVQLTSGSN
ncbi:17503_t:CDS:2 [Rhizophagus irregularis]|nr:17503_t:CDS:2 [Rhizophagus irregularis]